MSIGLNSILRLLLIATIGIFHGILKDSQRYGPVTHFVASVCHGPKGFGRRSALTHSGGPMSFTRSLSSVSPSSTTECQGECEVKGGCCPGHSPLFCLKRDHKLHPRRVQMAYLSAPLNEVASGTHGWSLWQHRVSRGKGRWRVKLLPDQEKHRALKDLYLKREKYLNEPRGKMNHFYRYFNITMDNIEHHLNATMDEFFANEKEKASRAPYIVDGNSFSGRYFDLNLPVPREWASYEFVGQNPNALKPLSQTPANVEPKFNDELLTSIYQFISGMNNGSKLDKSDQMSSMDNGQESTPENESDQREKRLMELYDEVGDYEYKLFENLKVYRKDYLQDMEFRSDENAKKQRELLHNVMIQPTQSPSYIDPDNPVFRTGRRRELQRKRDSGRLQRLRWHMDVDFENDIPRGRRRMGDNVTKEFLDSIEWEQPLPTYHDRNFFKRSFYEGGFGEEDRTPDSYFDAQFIGSTDAYPFAVSAGMQFTWPIYWVPMLSKRHPKRRGQPIRSQMFNLGGVEPLQLWFYPEGTASSIDGYCSLKLVSPPGWCLPYRIYLFVFSEYNRVVLGPMYRESPDYVSSSLNTCRLVGKDNKNLVNNPENDNDYVILGPSGNVYVGVGIVDEPVTTHSRDYEFKYDWDEGDYDFNQWLKKQTADPDDKFTADHIKKDQTHSIWYESHKYKYVPDRHISRYWRTRYTNSVRWSPPDF